MTEDWSSEAQNRIHDLLSELAASGKLSSNESKGMILSATVIIEFMGEDGGDWHSIVGVPRERWRDLVVHHKLLGRLVDGAESAEEDEEE